MTEHQEDEDFSHLWLGSWKLHAELLACFTLSLIKPLSSSAPLVAVYFPGALIVASGWAIVRHFRTATATLFLAHATSGRDVYRTAALWSLWLTIPSAVLTAVVVLFRARIRERADADRRS
ncbi:hypothetical protein [Aeromicrobium sp. Root472D3]|uniref:hypothetical protein n=1 Tax=Aeromicrobium sp. Root472D3 TaxID=1736540 RepID=UPI0006F3B74D|nr:hypothetical protein [Aeromicrobium sp. Root472D3]KQX74445.1 hypothetical protein ASD10_04190 [Aeromicrobium sp. Root472D3]